MNVKMHKMTIFLFDTFKMSMTDFFFLYVWFQSEQKKFLQQHKARSETYSKAAANMKKYRKKGNKGGGKTGLATDKELKVNAICL